MDEPLQTPAPAPAPYTTPVTHAPAAVMPPKGSNTGKVIGIFIAVVVVAAAVYYFVGRSSGDVAMVSPSPTASASESFSPSPTTDPTAGWKTYTNTQTGYEFNYPSSWIVAQDGIHTEEFGNDSQAEAGESHESKEYFAVVPYGTFEVLDTTLSAYATTEGNVYPCPASSLRNVIIGGSPAIRCTSSYSEFGATGRIENTFIQKGNQVFKLFMAVRNELPLTEQESFVSVFDQILSTFKFIAEPTAGWKTYANTAVGLEFKYPSAWKIDTVRSNTDTVVFDRGIPEDRQSVQVTSTTKTMDQIREDYSGSSPSSITVDGVPAIRISQGEFGIVTVLFVKTGLLYRIDSTGGLMTDTGALSTFKITQ